jgi:hypothetical protein
MHEPVVCLDCADTDDALKTKIAEQASAQEPVAA